MCFVARFIRREVRDNHTLLPNGGQPHQVTNRPGDSCCPHDHSREQDERQSEHEDVILVHPPLQPPHRLSTGKACCLLRLRCACPRINRVLKGDPIHGLKDAVKRKRYPCRNGSEPTHPPQCSRSDIKSEEQNEQSKKEDSHEDELP